MSEIKNEEDKEESINQENIDKIEEIIDSNLSDDKKRELLDEYHENDIATVVEKLSKDERIKLYKLLGTEKTAEIFAYLDNVDEFVDEIGYDKAADIIEQMDADDAIDVLDELEDKDKENIINLMEDEAKEDVKLIDSYDDDMIGAKMTTNFISIPYGYTVKQAMKSLISQAAENDNVNFLYVVKDNDEFYGSIELRDLIILREGMALDDIIHTTYPTVLTTTKIEDCLNELREYDLDCIPVLNEKNQLVGVITQSDITESVDEQLSDDYAKLAGLTEENDFDEPLLKSMKKRIPWLVILMFLGLVVSMLTGAFENVIKALPAIVFFQSMILDMAGNVGTQSLAVTIRAISEEHDKKMYFKIIWKEIRIGFMNGLMLGVFSAILITIYLGATGKVIETGVAFSWFECAKAGGIVGVSLIVAMTLSSFTGTAFPILLTKLKVDPAVASGPFITTINDIIAVVVYYSLAYLLFLVL